MLEAVEWHQKTITDRTVKSLSRNGFKAVSVSSKDEALAEIMKLIPEGAVVGLGGSVTLRQINLPEQLRQSGHTVADHWVARAEGASTEELTEIRRRQLNSDVFITSANALTETGELVNIDGAGQRVAAMIFGPKRVIVVAGTNKIVKDVDSAVRRARNVAAPINAWRLKVRTPCAQTGVCSDCDSRDRICNITTIIHRAPSLTDTTVILVDEPLGY
jgi:L-lactate utilization protein LutB